MFARATLTGAGFRKAPENVNKERTVDEMTKDGLQAAIEQLGAKDLGNGFYAFTNDECWLVTDNPSLEAERIKTFQETGDDLISDDEAIEMPAWWTPERQYAIAFEDGQRDNYASLETAQAFRSQFHDGEPIITADLTTGEEVPA